MTKPPSDGTIDRLVNEKWLAIGLSQTDIAELLDAALQPLRKDGGGPPEPDAGRLALVAAALGVQTRRLRGHGGGTGHETAETLSGELAGSRQTLLQLRLLRAFCELSDPRAQRTLVYLAERLVKCAGQRPGDAG